MITYLLGSDEGRSEMISQARDKFRKNVQISLNNRRSVKFVWSFQFSDFFSLLIEFSNLNFLKYFYSLCSIGFTTKIVCSFFSLRLTFYEFLAAVLWFLAINELYIRVILIFLWVFIICLAWATECARTHENNLRFALVCVYFVCAKFIVVNGINELK